MTNLRVNTVNTVIESEALAPRTTIFWDPVDNSGRVYFQCVKYFRMTGTSDYFGAPAEDGGVEISLADMLARTINIQTPEGVMPLPAVLIMAAVKTLFDELYNEQRATPVTLPQEP